MLGLIFKPNTDDMREGLALIPKFQEAGASIRVHYPIQGTGFRVSCLASGSVLYFCCR